MSHVTVAEIVAVAAAGIAVLCLIASAVILAKVRAKERMLESEIERGKQDFDAIVARELTQRGEELESTLARVRADALSELPSE